MQIPLHHAVYDGRFPRVTLEPNDTTSTGGGRLSTGTFRSSERQASAPLDSRYSDGFGEALQADLAAICDCESPICIGHRLFTGQDVPSLGHRGDPGRPVHLSPAVVLPSARGLSRMDADAN